MEKKEFNENFTPRIIGVDELQASNTIEAWINYVEIANDFKNEIYSFFNKNEDAIELFREFGNLNIPDTDFIIKLFETRNPQQSGEFNYRKMAVAGMLVYSPGLLPARNSYFKARNNLRTFSSFSFDLMECAIDGFFSLPENFIGLVRSHYTTMTKSQDENEIVQIAEVICESLNDLIERGLIKSHLGIKGIFMKLADCYVFRKDVNERPVVISPLLLKRIKLHTVDFVE